MRKVKKIRRAQNAMQQEHICEKDYLMHFAKKKKRKSSLS